MKMQPFLMCFIHKSLVRFFASFYAIWGNFNPLFKEKFKSRAVVIVLVVVLQTPEVKAVGGQSVLQADGRQGKTTINEDIVNHVKTDDGDTWIW